MKVFIAAFFLIVAHCTWGQDTTIQYEKKMVTMPMAIIRSDLNVPSFIKHVMNDTSFYKAFKNLRILEYTSYNDVNMMNKKGSSQASLKSKTQQVRNNNCRITKVIEETTTGDFYNKKKEYNYYTAQLYASLFFATTEVCNENNIVGTEKVSAKGSSGMDKRKQQLKMLFFNPGAKINGIPFMGNKTALYDDDLANFYNFSIDSDDFKQVSCYKFSTKTKDSLTKSQRNQIVIDEMVTWFRADNLQIMGRRYSLSYNAGVYDFNVEMEIEMDSFGSLTVPVLIRYKGNWDVAFKKRERGAFTATLFDFKYPH
jgi:hypothetical protein